MSRTEQLETETEQVRGRIEEDLDMLRSRLNPSHLADQLAGYFRDNDGAMLLQNLGRQIARNPAPIALIGAGLAWLAVSSRRSTAAEDSGEPSAHSGNRSFADPAAAGPEGFQMAAKAASEAIPEQQNFDGGDSENPSSISSRLRDSAATAYDAAAGAVQDAAASAGRMAKTVAHSASATSERVSSVTDLMREHPIVMAGLGIAIGAAIGAVLPSTKIEDEWMGDASDDFKKDATEFTKEQAHKAAAVAERAWEGAKEEVRQQAGQPDGMGGGRHSAAAEASMAGTEATLVPEPEETAQHSTDDAVERFRS